MFKCTTRSSTQDLWMGSLSTQVCHPTSFLQEGSCIEPNNADGVDLSASNVLIDKFEIHNGDDVINISPPATNVTMRNVIASGTHGLSVSCSSGTGGNYTFEKALVYDSLMAARFKGVLGETCNVSDVTWRNIEVRNVSFPIHFIENYYDQEKSAPNSSTSAIAAYAKNFTWENITGSVSSVVGDGSCITDPCWYATLGKFFCFPCYSSASPCHCWY
jgi:galacturan 1,4-alpha-galacturonidase